MNTDAIDSTRIGRIRSLVLRGHTLLVMSTLFQIVWLLLIWATKATNQIDKIYFLLMYTAITGAALYFFPQTGADKKLIPINWSDRRKLFYLSIAVALIGIGYSKFQIFQALATESGPFNASLVVARQGLSSFFDQYTEIYWLGIQHPPLVPIMNGLVIQFLGESIFISRLVSLVFGIGTIWLVYYLARDLRNSQTGLLAAFVFACQPYFLRLSTAISNDMQITFFSTLTLLVILRLRHASSNRLSIFGGVAMALGLLSKYNMLLVYPIAVFIYWQNYSSKHFRQQLLLLLAIATTLLSGWIAFAYNLGIFDLQKETLAGFSSTQVQEEWGNWMFLEFVFTRLPSALGVYTIPTVVIGIFLMGISWQTSTSRLLSIWICSFFVPFSLTLPDARYCLPAFPVIAILAADGMEHITSNRWKVIASLAINCAGSLYLFIDWQRTHHLFIEEYLPYMP